MNGSFDSLLQSWRHTYDAMNGKTAELRRQIARLQEELEEVEAPYKEQMALLKEEIEPRALNWGRTYKGGGVEVRYRRGYERVSYDSGRVDSIMTTLRSIVPSVAESLEEARKTSYVAPSVTVVAVDEEE
jgi:hypothetical protein